MPTDTVESSRRSSARKARDQNERAGQIVAFATDAIISKDRAGLITSWNLGAERLYGYREDQVLGHPISLIIPEALKGEEWELLQRVLRAEHIEHYETLRRCKDDTIINVSLTLFALRDTAGEIVGAASIAHDTSRRIAAEQELHKSERIHSQILESAAEGIWRIDAELVTDYANPSIAEMLGYTVEEMLGSHLADFLDDEGMSTARASMERQSRGVTERMEVSLLRKDGAVLPALVSVNAVFDDAGTISGNLAIVTDLSKQRQAETHLRKTETFLASVTESMEEGLLTLDVDGRIATVNHAAKDMLGYEAGDLIGRTLCEGLGCARNSEQRCAGPGCPLTAVHSSLAPMHIDDEVLVRKDGVRLPVSIRAEPLGDERGGPTGHIVVFHDIGELKTAKEQAQHELEELSWIGRLRDAMDEDRLVLAGQPIISLDSGEVVGRELLVRLRDRGGALVMPGKFLPAAERFGLICDLDRWVIGRAARLAAQGSAINVNLSACSLADVELADQIEKLLAEAHADPKLITFEITETALTEYLELASRFTARMATLGCKFALDDFGTGYGAFTYLKTLPIKYLKIDMEFVRDLLDNKASQHLVSATVQLARGFGQKTVAEGVEDAETCERLRELEIDFVQGYYLGRPEVLTES
ncbi:MAG TPA: EAL domain-containing protein [Solirubrobacteraceae bacterium]